MATFQDVGGQQTQFMGPDAAKQSRRLAEMLMSQGMDTQGLTHWTQALGKVLQSGVGVLRNDQASADVRDGSMAGNQALAQMLSGGSPDAAMANPYSAPDALKMQVADRNASRSFANQKALLEERLRMQNADPMRQLQMEKLRADIEATRSGGGVQTRVGLQPVYGRDAQGNVVVLQPSASGQMIQSEVPEGVTIDPGLVAGAKAEAAGEGKNRAEARLNLTKAEQMAEIALDTVEKIRTHPGRDQATGYGSLLPDIAFTNRTGMGFITLLNQATGGAFLQAFESLKGGGHITEIEGVKATQAIARMNRSTTREDFDAALNDYTGVIKLGLEKARARAGVGTSQTAPPAEPGAPQAAPAAPPPGNFVWNPQTRQLEAR